MLRATRNPDSLDLLPEPVLIVTEDGEVVASNAAARALLEPLNGREPCEMSLGAMLEDEPRWLLRFLRQAARCSELVPGSFSLANTGTEPTRVDVYASAIPRPGRTPLVLIRFRRERRQLARFLELAERAQSLRSRLDLSERAASHLRRRQRQLAAKNRKLRTLASCDALTGLANRRTFDQVLADEWRRAERCGAPLGLVLFDVDNFKHYNDRYGHPGGDECLRRVGKAIAKSVRDDEDLAARYGGEEFACILPETDRHGAARAAARIVDGVRALGLEHAGLADRRIVTVSAGAHATVPGVELRAPAELIERADRALYAAKAAGRDRYVVAEP
jgi:diguanylate cyclase (GGDEF)-like protein